MPRSWRLQRPEGRCLTSVRCSKDAWIPVRYKYHRLDGYTDSQARLLYLINRYYDPASAQFLTVDPIVGATGQPYQYVDDDPLNRVDPSGLSWWNPVSWSANTWSNIASVAAFSAAFIPGVDVVAGAVAIGAGAVAAGEHASQGDWTAASLDIAGVGVSVFGVGEAIVADRDLKAAAGAVKGYGYLSPMYKSDAATAAARAAWLSRFGAALGGVSFGLPYFMGGVSVGLSNLLGGC